MFTTETYWAEAAYMLETKDKRGLKDKILTIKYSNIKQAYMLETKDKRGLKDKILTIKYSNIKQATPHVHWSDHCPCISSWVIPLY